MPYYPRRKRYVSKRKAYGRKRKYGMKKRTGFGKKYHGVKYFTETIQSLITVVSPGAPTTENDYNLSVRFQDCPNYTTYASLFKQFAILGIKYIYRPNYTNSLANAANQGIPRMFYVEDKMETGVLPIATIQEQDNCKVLMSSKSWSKYVKIPQPVVTQGNGLGQEIQVQQRARDIYWLDTNDHNAQAVLYLTGLLDIAGSATAMGMGTISAKVYLAFKEQQ